MAPPRTFLRLAALFLALALGAHAATFLENLTPARKRQLGLDRLTPAQLAELDAAVEQYRKEGASTAAAEAVARAATQATAAAVEEYREKEEPGVVARALDVFKRKHAEEQQERIAAMLPGKFDGWDGATLFPLDNGQVWRQSRPGTYFTKARTNVPVVVYKAPSGYWRLRILDDEGAWVTVVRVK